jgi:pimeloyl-ACP methyl ester carboxylesterase
MTVTVQGAPIFVIDEGAGSPTLFLHGNPDSADLWRGLIDHLGDRYRCLAADLPGFGRSGAPAAFDGSLTQMAGFVDGLVEALGLSAQLNLVGHDFGAQFSLAWAIEHPERVRRIVVSNTNFFSDYRWHSAARLLRTPLLGELTMALTNAGTLTRALRQAAPRLPAEHIRRAAALYTPAAKRMALRLYRAGDPRQFVGWEDRLLELTGRVPTCVLWGDQDPFAPAGTADRFGARVVHHFPEYSHWVVVEAVDAVAARLRAFLD